MSWDVHLVLTEVRTGMQRLHNGFLMGGRYLLGDRLASGGMAVKLDAAFTALDAGVPGATITDLQGLAAGTGTLIAR